MRTMSKTYICLLYGGWCILGGTNLARAQATSSADASPSCAALLANDSSAGTHIGPGDSASRARDTSSRARADTAAFGVGGARTGDADVLLLVGVQATKCDLRPSPRVRVGFAGEATLSESFSATIFPRRSYRAPPIETSSSPSSCSVASTLNVWPSELGLAPRRDLRNQQQESQGRRLP